MKTFFKSYAEYQKNVTELSKVWYKKHWKGTVVINILILVATIVWVFHDEIKEKVLKVNRKRDNKIETEA